MTDGQRSRVYGAEQLVRRTLDRSSGLGEGLIQLHGSTMVLEQERRFGNLETVQAYIGAVQAMGWYRDRYPAVEPITVRHRKGDTKATYRRSTNTIAINFTERAGDAWGMREMVVLHEMAHAASDGRTHDARFCREFVVHVQQVIGSVAGFLLETVLFEEGCEVAHLDVSQEVR